MSTVTLVGELIDGVVDSTGTRVASGNAHFYALGTLTPITVYSDKAGATPISQPLVLTAGGTGIVYTTGAARMIVKDALDTTTILDVNVNTPRYDGVYVSSAAFNGGSETTLKTILDGWTTAFGGAAGIFQYKQSAGATERNPKDWMSEVHLSVKDFGAKGDGLTDDTAAIQATATAVGAAGSGIVFFPPGTYLISAAIALASKNGVSFVGTLSSTIKNTNTATNCLTFTACTGFTIEGLTFTHSSTSSGTCISFLGATSNVYIDHINIDTTHLVGISIAGTTFYTYIYNSVIQAQNAQATARCISYSGLALIGFVGNCSFLGVSTGACVEFAGASSDYRIANCDFSPTCGTGIIWNAALTGTRFTVYGCTSISALTTPFNIAVATDPLIRQWGNNVDGTTVNVTSGGTVTPNRALGAEMRIRGTTTGAAYIINAPTPPPTGGATGARDLTYTIRFFNNAGGAVTGWTLNAAYHTTAAISTVDLNYTTVVFKWDTDVSVWREVSRAVTT